MPNESEISVVAKIMLRSNVDVAKELVNSTIAFTKEIIRSHVIAHRSQKETDIHEFVWRLLHTVPSLASTVHTLQGSTVDNAVLG